MRPSKRFVLPIAIAVPAAAVSVAVAAPWAVVGKRSSSGDYAIAIATAGTRTPAAVAIRVVATPRQQATVTWTLVCSKGRVAASRSGRFTATTPVQRPMPLPLARPDHCIASGVGATARRGTVTVQILRQ